MTRETFGNALGLLRQRGFTHVVLTGGEPTVHPQFDLFVVDALNAEFAVTVLTNGSSSWTPKHTLTKEQIRHLWFCVGRDYPDDVHLLLRGHNVLSPDGVINRLRCIGVGTTACSVVTKMSYGVEELLAHVHRMKKVGANRVSIQPVMLHERANRDRYAPSTMDAAFWRNIKQLRNQGAFPLPMEGTDDYFDAAYAMLAGFDIQVSRCTAVLPILFPNGEAKACVHMPYAHACCVEDIFAERTYMCSRTFGLDCLGCMKSCVSTEWFQRVH